MSFDPSKKSPNLVKGAKVSISFDKTDSDREDNKASEPFRREEFSSSFWRAIKTKLQLANISRRSSTQATIPRTSEDAMVQEP